MKTLMLVYFGLLATFVILYCVKLELTYRARKAYWVSDRWPADYGNKPISFDAQFYDLTTWRPSTIQAQLHKSITGEDA